MISALLFVAAVTFYVANLCVCFSFHTKTQPTLFVSFLLYMCGCRLFVRLQLVAQLLRLIAAVWFFCRWIGLD